MEGALDVDICLCRFCFECIPYFGRDSEIFVNLERSDECRLSQILDVLLPFVLSFVMIKPSIRQFSRFDDELITKFVSL